MGARQAAALGIAQGLLPSPTPNSHSLGAQATTAVVFQADQAVFVGGTVLQMLNSYLPGPLNMLKHLVLSPPDAVSSRALVSCLSEFFRSYPLMTFLTGCSSSNRVFPLIHAITAIGRVSALNCIGLGTS